MSKVSSGYARAIEKVSKKYPANLIEGWMRMNNGTLDGLRPEDFHAEVLLAEKCIDKVGIKDSSELAASFGL